MLLLIFFYVCIFFGSPLNNPLEIRICVLFIFMSPKPGNAWLGVVRSFVNNLFNTYNVYQTFFQNQYMY